MFAKKRRSKEADKLKPGGWCGQEDKRSEQRERGDPSDGQMVRRTVSEYTSACDTHTMVMQQNVTNK